MKKTTLLHAELSRAIAGLGHGDRLVIADAGLPVPAGTPCIDLAVTRGVPPFEAVLGAVLSEMCVERAMIAVEAHQRSPGFVSAVSAALAGVPVIDVSHADLKDLTAGARAVVRTGECTPYANVVLIAGVVF